MGKRISKYLISLEAFHKEVSTNSALSDFELRLKRFDRCMKAMILRENLEKLLYNIQHNIPDMEECGIDYEEWASSEKWSDAKKPQTKAVYQKGHIHLIDELTRCVDKYNEMFYHPANVTKEELRIKFGFRHDELSQGWNVVTHDSNLSDAKLDLLFSIQIDEIRELLSNIYKEKQKDKKIANTEYSKLYQHYAQKFDNQIYQAKLISEYKKLKEEFPSDLTLAHYKEMRGLLINKILENVCFKLNIKHEIVEEDKIDVLRDEVEIYSNHYFLDLDNEEKLKSYNKFHRLCSFENDNSKLDYVKLGKEFHRLRAELTDEEIYDLIWGLKIIERVDDDIKKAFPLKVEKKIKNGRNKIDKRLGNDIKDEPLIETQNNIRQEHFCYIHPTIVDDETKYKIDSEIEHLVKSFSVPEICEYLKNMDKEKRLFLPREPGKVMEELKRFGMPNESKKGFSSKNFSKYYNIIH